MDRGQKEVVLKEVAACERVSQRNLMDPIGDLQPQKDNAEARGETSIPHRDSVSPAPCRLYAASDRPGARQQSNRGKHPEPQLEMRLGSEKCRFVPTAVIEIDPEIRREDERFEDHEYPHVRLAGYALRLGHRGSRRGRFKCCHDASSSAAGFCLASSGNSGSGPVPKSSRRIMCRSNIRKTPVQMPKTNTSIHQAIRPFHAKTPRWKIQDGATTTSVSALHRFR